MENVNLGIIGMGYMGLHHLKLLRQMNLDRYLDNVSIEMVCDPDENHLEDVVNEYNIPKKSTEPLKAIKDENINAIIIASPTKYHNSQANAALELRKPTYCEKPLGIDAKQSRELTDKAKQLNTHNQAGLVLRHSPSCTYIKELLEKEELGKPLWVNYRHDSFFPSGGIYRGTWKNDSSVSGGGILKEANVHDIDLLTFLFGDYEIEKSKMNKNEREIETFASIDFYSGNLRINFETLWHSIQNRGTSRRMEIYCENGLITAEDFMFEGAITYQKSGEDPISLNKKQLFNEYAKRNGLGKDFKKYRNWYSSISDLEFIRSIKSGDVCYPFFEIATKADEKIQNIYDHTEVLK